MMKPFLQKSIIVLLFISLTNLCNGIDPQFIPWPKKSTSLKFSHTQRQVENMIMPGCKLSGVLELNFDSIHPYTAKKKSTTHSIAFVNTHMPSIKMSIDIFEKEDFMKRVDQASISKYSSWLQNTFKNQNFTLYEKEDFNHKPFLMLNEFPPFITWSKLNSQGKEMIYRQYFLSHKGYNIVVSIESPEKLFKQAHESMHPIWAFSQYGMN